MQPEPGVANFVVEDVTIIDATGRPPQPHSDLLVRDGRIAVIEPCGATGYPDLPVLDGRGRYLIPGMWETQAHLTRYSNGVMEDSALRWPEEGDVGIVEANIRSYLRTGFTTVVDLGGPTEVLHDVRERLQRGSAVGANVLYVGRQFVAPGGLPRFGDRPVDSLLVEVGDPRAAIAALEEMFELGVNAIKINHTPGFLLFGTGWPVLNRYTLRAIIEHSHSSGLPVVVHIDDADSAAEVLELGVDGIEHTFESPAGRLDADVARITQLCLDTGAYWAMTVAYLEGISRAGDWTLLDHLGTDGHVLPGVLDQATTDPRSMWVSLPKDLREYFRRRFDEGMAQLRPVHDAGVRMTISTDSGNPCTFHGLTSRREMELMAEAGISPDEILQAATRHAAEKFRLGDELGTLEPGKRADMVLLTENPLSDIGHVGAVELVIQDGIVHRPADIPL